MGAIPLFAPDVLRQRIFIFAAEYRPLPNLRNGIYSGYLHRLAIIATKV
ncbi:MAG: hypothetical protein ACJATK_001435 [Paracoccaceae bacterium]|jgi:hypothetical protein